MYKVYPSEQIVLWEMMDFNSEPSGALNISLLYLIVCINRISQSVVRLVAIVHGVNSYPWVP